MTVERNAAWRFYLLAFALALVAGSLALVFLTLLDHRLSAPGVQAFDTLWQCRVHSLSRDHLDAPMLALTDLGAIKFFASALACVLLYLLWLGRRHAAALLAWAVAVAFILNELLKLHFHRPRPAVPWALGDEHTFSLPSGHSLFSVVLYGTLTYLALRETTTPARRVAILLPAILLPLGIGLSRIYLGEHFPTDVLAGFLTGALWLTAIVVTDRQWHKRKRASASEA